MHRTGSAGGTGTEARSEAEFVRDAAFRVQDAFDRAWPQARDDEECGALVEAFREAVAALNDYAVARNDEDKAYAYLLIHGYLDWLRGDHETALTQLAVANRWAEKRRESQSWRLALTRRFASRNPTSRSARASRQARGGEDRGLVA